MSMTLEEVKAVFDQAEINYFADPDQPYLIMAHRADDRSITTLVSLSPSGTGLHLRSANLISIPADDPRIAEVHRLLLELNGTYRLLTLSWDANSGEVTGAVEHVLEDQAISVRQLTNLVEIFVATLYAAVSQIEAVMAAEHQRGGSPALGSSAGLERLLDLARERIRSETESEWREEST